MERKYFHGKGIAVLKKCGVFYLATVEGDQPRVRPFGAVCGFEGKLYIITSNQKKVFDQMQKNQKVEFCGMSEGKWLRLSAEVIRDTRIEAKKAMLEDNPSLRGMYSEDDDIMEVLYLKNAEASLCSFTEEPEIWMF